MVTPFVSFLIISLLVTQSTYAYLPAAPPRNPPGTAQAGDALGRRIQKNVNGVITRYVYDHEDIVLEYDGSNTLLARYTHGPGVDEPWLLERDLNANGLFESNEVFTYHADALGSIVSMTDSTGDLLPKN